MLMNIRKMTISDYDEVYKLWINTPGMGFNNMDDSRGGIEKFLKRNPSTCFVAEDENRIVGAILGGHDGRRGFIYHTAVSAMHRKKGIGSMLVKNVMIAFKAEGINKAALVAFEKNTDGNAFWEKMGFTDRPDLIYRNKSINEMIRIDT